MKLKIFKDCKMASRYFSEEDLICPVCLDIFRQPVLLSCNHNVCKTCIETFWENQASKECPVCRRRSSKDYPPVHFALYNQCEAFQEERRRKSSSGTCSAHRGKLRLFCLDDQQLVCVVCRDSRKHTNHRFCPLDEAVIDKKEILKAALKSLQEKRRTFENVSQSFCQTAEQIKIKTQQTKRQIKAEFKELHQLLHDEEAARLTALREEEQQKIQMMIEKTDNMSRQISSLTQTIGDITEQMKADDFSFLQNVKSMLQRVQDNLLVPEPSPAVTISLSNHLTNLKLTVLQKMQENVGRTMHFKSDHSDFHTAMETLNNPVKRTEYKHFPISQLSGTKCFRVKLSRKGSKTVSWDGELASLKTPNPVHTVPLSHDRSQFPKQHPQYETTETMPCSQTNRPVPLKRHTKNNPGSVEDQNPDMQFPGVKDLVKKINEQMKM